jgi:hypothetical protein
LKILLHLLQQIPRAKVCSGHGQRFMALFGENDAENNSDICEAAGCKSGGLVALTTVTAYYFIPQLGCLAAGKHH